MRIWERMGLLARADAHAVMDQLEERSLLLKQHLREAELELDRKRARLEALEEEARRLAQDFERESARVAAIDEDVELSLAGGKEELARFAVRRLLPRRAALAAVRDRAAEVERSRGRIAEQLDVQEGQLADLRRHVKARLAADEQRGISAPFAEDSVADEEVELEILRRRRGAGSEAVREEQ